MTLLNLFRRTLGLMPANYSSYKTRGLFLMTFKGYRTGLSSPSLLQLKKLAWEHWHAQVNAGNNRRQSATSRGRDKPAATGTVSRKIQVA